MRCSPLSFLYSHKLLSTTFLPRCCGPWVCVCSGRGVELLCWYLLKVSCKIILRTPLWLSCLLDACLLLVIIPYKVFSFLMTMQPQCSVLLLPLHFVSSILQCVCILSWNSHFFLWSKIFHLLFSQLVQLCLSPSYSHVTISVSLEMEIGAGEMNFVLFCTISV